MRRITIDWVPEGRPSGNESKKDDQHLPCLNHRACQFDITPTHCNLLWYWRLQYCLECCYYHRQLQTILDRLWSTRRGQREMMSRCTYSHDAQPLKIYRLVPVIGTLPNNDSASHLHNTKSNVDGDDYVKYDTHLHYSQHIAFINSAWLQCTWCQLPAVEPAEAVCTRKSCGSKVGIIVGTEKNKWDGVQSHRSMDPKNHAAAQAKLQSTRKNKKGYPKRGFKDWYMALMNWLTTAISGKMQEMVVF